MDSVEQNKLQKYKFTIDFLFLFSLVLFIIIISWYSYFTCFMIKKCTVAHLYYGFFLSVFVIFFLLVVRIKRDAISKYFASLIKKKKQHDLEKSLKIDYSKEIRARFNFLQLLSSQSRTLSREEFHEKLYFSFKNFLSAFFRKPGYLTTDELSFLVKRSKLSSEMKHSITSFLEKMRDDFYGKKPHTKEHLYSELHNSIRISARLLELFE